MGIYQRQQKTCKRCGYVKGIVKETYCPKCGEKLTVGKKVWYISVYYNGRRIKKAIGSSKAEALKAYQMVKADIYRGEYRVKKKSDNILFREFAQTWLENYSKIDNREDTYIRNKILAIRD